MLQTIRSSSSSSSKSKSKSKPQKPKPKPKKQKHKNNNTPQENNETPPPPTTTYHAIGFGTNYFYSFGKHAISFHDLLPPPPPPPPELPDDIMNKMNLSNDDDDDDDDCDENDHDLNANANTNNDGNGSRERQQQQQRRGERRRRKRGQVGGGGGGGKQIQSIHEDKSPSQPQQPQPPQPQPPSSYLRYEEYPPCGYFFPLHPDDIPSSDNHQNNSNNNVNPNNNDNPSGNTTTAPFSPLSNSSTSTGSTAMSNSHDHVTPSTNDNVSSHADNHHSSRNNPKPAPPTAKQQPQPQPQPNRKKFNPKKMIPPNLFSMLRPSASSSSSSRHNTQPPPQQRTNNNNTNHDSTSSDPNNPNHLHPPHPLPYPLPPPPSLPTLSLGSTHLTTLSTTHSSPLPHLLGTLHGKTYPLPTPLPSPQLPHLHCLQIACGKRHCVALFERSVVMTWGNGYFGQLGHGLGEGDRTVCEKPMVVERLLERYVGGAGVVRVEAGGMHSAAIVDVGSGGGGRKGLEGLWERRRGRGGEGVGNLKGVQTRVFHWGSNRYGQCAVDVSSSGGGGGGAGNGGNREVVGYPLPMVNVYHPESGKRVSFVSIAMSRRHCVGLTLPMNTTTASSSPPGGGDGVVSPTSPNNNNNNNNPGSIGGELYSWGSTAAGRCGHGNQGTSTRTRSTNAALPKRIEALRNVNIVQVEAGDAHTLALSESGRVFSWGVGSSGQLGHGHIMQVLSPRLVADLEFGGKGDGGGSGFGGGKEALTKAVEEEEGRRDEVFRFGGEEGCVVGGGGVSTPISGGNSVDAVREGDVRRTYADENLHSPPSALSHIHYPATPPKKSQAVFTTHKNTNTSNHTSSDYPTPPPRVTRICAAGDYSAAVVGSTGDLYTWGCGDGQQLGHGLPIHNNNDQQQSQQQEQESMTVLASLSSPSDIETITTAITEDDTVIKQSFSSQPNNTVDLSPPPPPPTSLKSMSLCPPILSPSVAASLRSSATGGGGGRRVRDATSFDSRLNVLIPRRVDCLDQFGLKVEDVECSSHCMALICSSTPNVQQSSLSLASSASSSYSDGDGVYGLFG